MNNLHSSLWPVTATITPDDRLSLGGCDILALAREFGTPLYVLDEATFHHAATEFVSKLQLAYPGASAVHYAGKALLNSGIAQLITRWGIGVDCVSLGELAVARHAGVPLDHVHLHGNAKPRRELEQALAWGVGRIVADSLDELRLLDELTRERASHGQPPQPILLRVNPGVDVHTHAHVQTGQLDSKFGLPIEAGMALQAVEYALQAPGLELVGLHAHLGSQIMEMQPYVLGVDRMLAFAAELQTRYGWQLRELSPGGGLGVPYQIGDPVPEIAAFAQTLADTVVAGCERWNMRLPKLVIEPGRSLIARAVIALYEVVAVKTIPGVRTFVAVDGGMGDNIRPALYEARYSVIRADQTKAAATDCATVVGRYCESGDVLLRDVLLPPLEPGALLAVPMAGAYTLSMASTYNLVPRPALILVRDGQAHVLQRRETLTDLLLRDMDAPPVADRHET
jgi:diaminopimelate decarboxylase